MTIDGPVIAIGECMIELSDLEAGDGRVCLGFAGDTCNTAIYLARLLGKDGPPVSFSTALGQDSLSARMIGALRREGLDTDLIARLPDKLPGIYAIEIDATGERSFRYWREASAARAMFSEGGLTLQQLDACGLLYLSGITLAILPDADRARLLAQMKRLKAAGRQVAFDGNYRPKLWTSRADAAHWIGAALAASTIALPSIDDEMALFGDVDEAAVLDRLAASGPSEIVLKRGARGPVACSNGETTAPQCVEADAVVDTTAAGDSFNAGYLAARMQGASPARAARSGHALASQVIGHRGAILPRDVPLAR
jgi:2-dehydro-3-deoxygluconokinase